MCSATREHIEAIRSLLLPTPESEETSAVLAALALASEHGVDENDFSTLIKIESDIWLQVGKPPEKLKQIVIAAISHDDDKRSIDLAENYFAIHSALQSDEHRLSFDQASAFLSHSRLIITLRENTQMTASQVALLLRARDLRLKFSRQSVDLLFRKLSLSNHISKQNITELFKADAILSDQLFADASLEESVSMVGVLAQRLIGHTDIENWLTTLAPSDELSRFTPYIQILHYQCSVSEYYDFAVKDMYEFNPRGQAALKLFELYPDSMISAGNPFLNNAKSVEQLTEGWVRSKKAKQVPGAAALFGVLDSLQHLGFAARREMSSWLRMWIHRVMMASEAGHVIFSTDITTSQSRKLSEHVAAGNTHTSGVLEQRIVDACASALCLEQWSWKSRGLSDSVNTTNTSQKKLGDCEFQHSLSHKVKAFEAHGGKLTPMYVNEHLRTLGAILPFRVAEWEQFSEISKWTVEVMFIAHAIADDVIRIDTVIDQVRVVITAKLFSDFIREISEDVLRERIQVYLMEPLAQPRVPEKIRDQVRNLIG